MLCDHRKKKGLGDNVDELRKISSEVWLLCKRLKEWKKAREAEPMTDDFELRIEKLREAVDALDLAEGVILDFMREEDK